MERNPLAAEAHRASRLFRMGAIIELTGSACTLWLWAQTTSQPVPPWQSLAALAAIPVSCVLATRWKRRAVWYETTAEWWNRLDEAPPIFPFPRLVEWADRGVSRKRAAVMVLAPGLLATAALRVARSILGT